MKWYFVSFLLGAFAAFMGIFIAYAQFVSTLPKMAPVGWVYVWTGTRYPPGYSESLQLLGLLGTLAFLPLYFHYDRKYEKEAKRQGVFLVVFMVGAAVSFMVLLFILIKVVFPMTPIPVS